MYCISYHKSTVQIHKVPTLYCCITYHTRSALLQSNTKHKDCRASVLLPSRSGDLPWILRQGAKNYKIVEEEKKKFFTFFYIGFFEENTLSLGSFRGPYLLVYIIPQLQCRNTYITTTALHCTLKVCD